MNLINKLNRFNLLTTRFWGRIHTFPSLNTDLDRPSANSFGGPPPSDHWARESRNPDRIINTSFHGSIPEERTEIRGTNLLITAEKLNEIYVLLD